MSSQEITQLIHEYGLIVVFLAAGLQAIGFPIPGGTALVAAGIDASTRHGLPVVWVIVCGALGALIGTATGYGIGKWRGDRVLVRVGRVFRQKPERVHQLRDWFQDHGVWPVFIARFITGARNVAGLTAGATGMQIGRFLAVSALACVAWATIITLEYYFAGHVILGAPTWLQITLVVVGLIGTVLMFRLWRPELAKATDRAPNAAADVTD